MSEPVSAASVVPLHGSLPLDGGRLPSLLWARRTPGAPALAGFHVAPGGLIEPADRRAPHDGGEIPQARVAALRELFEEVGFLHAQAAERLTAAERATLRDALREDVEEGVRRFVELGLRWRTSDLVPLGRWVTPSYADHRFNTWFFALPMRERPDPDPDLLELDGAEWVTVDAALTAWRSARVLIAPPMYTLLRSLQRHGRLRTDEVCATFGAAGQESLRWEVVPHVQMLPLRTPTLPPATHTNSYLVGSGEAFLVEPATPFPDELDRTVAWVEESRRAGIHLVAMLVTHHHPDHVGGANALAARLGVPLWGHRLTAERLAGRIAFDRLIEDGERLSLDGPVPVTLRAVHTPGHAPGHLCFIEEASRAMIAGDMVAAVGTVLVEPTDGDMSLYLESLERMRGESPSVLLPAHGLPLHDADAVLARYIAHRLQREEKVLRALVRHEGPARPADLVPDAYDDAPRAVWPLATLSTEAHLLRLEREGRAVRGPKGWSPDPGND